jgi:thiol:disulfide interchange protein
MKRFFYLGSVICLCAGTVQAALSPWHTTPQGKARLIVSPSAATAKDSFYLGIEIQPAPGWILYWKNPGEAGIPPRFDFKNSRGMSNPVVLWPRPKLFVMAGDIHEYGYDSRVVYPVQARRTPGTSLEILADLNYLTCKESCIPQKFRLALSVPNNPTGDTESDALLQQFIQQVPQESDDQIITSLKPPTGGMQKVSTMALLGFLGGLLLNFMPCVLPILSVKLFGLLQHGGEHRSVVIRDALASASGIIVSFLIGAGLLISAKEAGHAVGWGIQFQNPAFVAFLFVLTALFAFNLWGSFQITLPPALAQWGSLQGSGEGPLAFFLSGMFATIMATPCSAPFLGTAMGFGISQSPRIILSIFLAAGVGMASPYLALAVFPGVLRWLPKPGFWMVKFERFLGILLAATALWLGWVFVHQVGWMRPTTVQTGPILWVPFQEDRIPAILETGRPVFVDVTADWCLTCKVNERFVLRDAEIVNAFKHQGFVMMRADWTTQDAAIGRYLASYNRAGIPFYAIYYPNRPPVALSELLTKSQVLQALK